MSEKEKNVLETLAQILPELPDSKKHELLGYGLALADMKEESKKRATLAAG